MRNLIDFIARFHAFFLFIVLQAISFSLIIQSHNYHNAGFFNSANYVSGNFFRLVKDVKEYVRLKQTNEQLAAENAFLRQFLYVSDSVPSLFPASACADESPFRFSYIPAKVLNNSTVKSNNYITLNKGSRHGVKKETGVIARQGIVGIVTDVSENFCIVMSVLHKKSNISVRLKKSRFIGNLNWEGGSTSHARISGVPVNALVENGDTVVTSGFSSIFPENIPVGKIVKVESTATSNFFEIQVELFTNFHTLEYVYIIRNDLQDEQKKLDSAHE
jgi:rod shape-determining protein MreC